MYLLEQLAGGIVSGQVISRIEAKGGIGKIDVVPALSLKAISYGIIDKKEKLMIPILKRAEDSKISHAGDIIMKLNRPYDSAFIEEDDEGYVIPSFCCKISQIHTDMADPYYLTGYLNSESAKQYLAASNGASAAALLKISDIKKLPVVLPSMEEQRLIGKVFQSCCKRKVLLQSMIEQERNLVEHMMFEIVREEMRDEEL